MATMTEPTTRTVKVPGAVLTYDIRPNADSTEPPLVAIGSPMGAGGFVTLASHFPDRTVVTYDPRGVERSTKDDPTSESTPEQHADDVHAIIGELGGGPVDLFASSGGAVNALALVARHPDDVRTLVAHEPPLAALTETARPLWRRPRASATRTRRSGFGPAMAQFILIVSHQGPIPAGFADQAPDPAMFGLPADDDGTRTDVLLAQNIVTSTHYEPDVDALRAAPTRDRHRGRRGVGGRSWPVAAARRSPGGSAREPVVFPSGHGGFLGGEYGQSGKPDEFAAKLREVLAG